MTDLFKFKVGDLLRPMKGSGRGSNYYDTRLICLVVKKFTQIDGQLYYEILEGDRGVVTWGRIHAEFNLEKL